MTLNILTYSSKLCRCRPLLVLSASSSLGFDASARLHLECPSQANHTTPCSQSPAVLDVVMAEMRDKLERLSFRSTRFGKTKGDARKETTCCSSSNKSLNITAPLVKSQYPDMGLTAVAVPFDQANNLVLVEPHALDRATLSLVIVVSFVCAVIGCSMPIAA